MYSSVKVTNYKSINELEIFKIPQLLLVGGTNNAGKSSLLEAIFLAMDRYNPEMLSRHLAFRGIQGVAISADAWWRPIFPNYDMDKQLKVELRDSKSKTLAFQIVHEKNYNASNISQQNPQNTQVSNFATTISSIAKPALHISATYDKKTVLDSHLTLERQGFALKVNKAEGTSKVAVFISSISRSTAQDSSIRFSQLDLENKTEQVLDVVKIIEPKIQKLSVISTGEGSEIYADVEGIPRKIPISLMGDGVGRILSIVLSILVCKDGLVLVDEIENGLHHSKLLELWKAIVKACITANCQLIATTHNYECLTAASRSIPSEKESIFSYVRLDRSKITGKLNSVHYSFAELSEAIEAELEVR